MISDAIPVTQWLIDSDVDARTTMLRMAKFCHKAMLDSYVVRTANDVIRVARSRDYSFQIAAISAYMQEHFVFVNNPVGVQLIRDPRSMLLDIMERGTTQGACDDAAVLIATLGMANGIYARFRALAFCYQLLGQCDRSATYSHVITDLFNGSEWQELDVTKPFDQSRRTDVVRTLTLDV